MKQVLLILTAVVVGCGKGKEIDSLKNENKRLRVELQNLKDITARQAQEREEVIQLPRHGGSALSSKERPLFINVIKNGSYSVRGKTVSLAELRGLLRETFAANPDQRVVIRGDAEALHGQTTAALAACTEAGFAKANIAWDTRTLQK